MSNNKKDQSLPPGVTIRDLRASWRKRGLPDDPDKLPWQGKALRPGTKRYVTECHRTKQEAITWAITERAKMMAGILPSEKCLVADHMDRYLLHLQHQGVGDDYYRQAKRILEDLISAGAKKATGATDDAAAEFGLKKSNVSRFRKLYKAVPWSLVAESCEVFGWTWREWQELIYAGGDVKLLYKNAPKDQGTAGVVQWCQDQKCLLYAIRRERLKAAQQQAI